MNKHKVMMQNIISILLLLVILSCESQNKSLSAEIEKIEQTPVVLDTMKLREIMGLFEPSHHPEFEMIEDKYSSKTGLYLRIEAYEDYKRMYDAAKDDGVDLIIHSATRNQKYQKGIWERKWNGQTLLEGGVDAMQIKDPKERAKKILLYSSMPGTSRHHWGTDIDLNSFNNSYFEKGRGLKIYDWLIAHASEYGFCQPYISKENGRTGYEEEKWHWSYMPISKDLTQYSERHLTNDMIKGFLGSETASDIDVVRQYVLGVNKQCYE